MIEASAARRRLLVGERRRLGAHREEDLAGLVDGGRRDVHSGGGLHRERGLWSLSNCAAIGSRKASKEDWEEQSLSSPSHARSAGKRRPGRHGLRRGRRASRRAPLLPPRAIRNCHVRQGDRAARLDRQAAKRKNCCARCGQPFGPGEKYTIVAEQHLHIKCYACPFCGASLSGGGGMATPGVGVGYCCQKCHIERYAERCAACNKPLQPGSRVAVHKGRRMHPACFACAVCAKPIDGKFHEHDNGPTCERCYTRNFAPRCAACQIPFEPAEEYVKVKGRALHPACFGCAVCATPLNIKGFYEKNGAAYCTQHYADKFGSKCALCATPMLSWTQNFHGDKYCSGHDAEMPKCFGCGRLVPDEPVGSAAPPAGAPSPGRSPRRALSSSGARAASTMDGRSSASCACPPRSTTSRWHGRSSPPSAPSSRASARHSRRWSACPSHCSTATRSPGWRRPRSTRRGGQVPGGIDRDELVTAGGAPLGRVVDETNDVTRCRPPLPKAMPARRSPTVWPLLSPYQRVWRRRPGGGGRLRALPTSGSSTRAQGREGAAVPRAHDRGPDPTYGGFRRALAAYYACSSSLPALLREVRRRGGCPTPAARASEDAAAVLVSVRLRVWLREAGRIIEYGF